MKALYFQEHGDLNVIQYGDVSDPSAGPDDVIVRVRACALNHLDIWVRRGWPGLKLGMPHWCGADVAGEIVEVGRNVTGWRAGQAVIVDPGVSLAADEYTRRGEDSLSPATTLSGSTPAAAPLSIWRYRPRTWPPSLRVSNSLLPQRRFWSA
ncbi:MAG: alcohol dehydrogenase catalytic domain-containing protein [Desulfobacterales bacterium]|jgi:NADPH2:quinone reductase